MDWAEEIEAGTVGTVGAKRSTGSLGAQIRLSAREISIPLSFQRAWTQKRSWSTVVNLTVSELERGKSCSPAMDLDLTDGSVGPGAKNANASESSALAELLEPELPGGAGGGGTNMKCTACGKVVSKEEVTKCVNLDEKVMCDEVCLKVLSGCSRKFTSACSMATVTGVVEAGSHASPSASGRQALDLSERGGQNAPAALGCSRTCEPSATPPKLVHKAAGAGAYPEGRAGQ